MANYEFRSDLKLGNNGENLVGKFLENKGGIILDKNNDNKYDLSVSYNGVIITYEIKTDVFCAPMFDTGNMFIEFESRGKLSGISVTKAKWFVTYFLYLNEIWFIEVEKLKLLIANNHFPTHLDSGDINSNTKGYLIKRKDYKSHFKVVCSKGLG
jgi:hypothetical protein